MAFRMRVLGCALALLCVGISASAQSSSFDLSGPTLEATVTRGQQRLPIAEVPNLQAGDHLWIQANLPATQSVHYLMVVAFLRGSTNPPPDGWFHRDDTWTNHGSEGLQLTVPKGAKQVLVLLAPETGGDYHSLVNAVKHTPGSFVRASQDLNEAMLDRVRLDTYLSAIRKVNASDPSQLQKVAPMLARSLSIKLNSTCFDAVSEEQAPCLMHSQNAVVLNDSQSSSITDTLTSGSVSDLAMQVSSTPKAGFGYYSPYISSVMDIARIMESFHSPQYQYIPALGMRKGKAVHLMLNTPPTFGKQKSVIVAAMPAVQAPQMPLLHAVDGIPAYCAEKTGLVLPVEGAPLVFATKYAHSMELRLKTTSGQFVSLPAQANAEKGGFVIDTTGLNPKQFGNTVQASLVGLWGFLPYHGPQFTLENVHPQPWLLAAGEAETLVVGSDKVVHLNAGDAVCVEKIELKSGAAAAVKTDWKALKPNELQVTLPLADAKPGMLTLDVTQYGLAQPETVTLQSFAKPSVLTGFSLHAGDSAGTLTGSSLDEVATLELDGATFVAEKTTGDDTLTMNSADSKKSMLLTAGSGIAHVRLHDGRVLTVHATIEPPRPQVELLARIVEPAPGEKSNIQLADANELPQTATLRFSVKAKIPEKFDRGEALEVATADNIFTTTLTMQNGGLTLQDLHTAVATLRPTKAFGESAFGPLQFRVVDKGVAGAWQPLVTLVRLPDLEKLDCPDKSIPNRAAPGAKAATCQLTGENLFLVGALSSDPSFQNAVQVPDGFPGETLQVPQPTAGQLYVKLRDDPAAVNLVALKSERPHRKRRPVVKVASKAKPQPLQPGAPIAPPATKVVPAASPEVTAPAAPSTTKNVESAKPAPVPKTVPKTAPETQTKAASPTAEPESSRTQASTPPQNAASIP